MSSTLKRNVVQTLTGRPSSDGDGVKLTRVFGGAQAELFDPFLMLDEFGSDEAADYVGGFPSHPHRGFETVTYMLDGRMLHQDHLGNRGLLEPGGVQWMTAGRGIIHSEMPQQDSGRMRGFQLWLNLPAAEKMQPAAYRDLRPDDVPSFSLASGASIKLIAGELNVDGQVLVGAITDRSTRPLYLDLHLQADQTVELPVAAELNALLYLYEGSARIEGEHAAVDIHKGQLARLGEGDRVEMLSGRDGAKLLLIAGKPLREPIVQYGPFVMNRREEIEQALKDYRDGNFGA
ncbi:pirin family protein [Halopseudomonas nanhaiensis]|uniref:pirin family protein n=1 Tax=Halopseudomonas nanhaiensis TaxID=2830842 RepID=UPI001CBB426A|nr:pirin family protein [Halopseudomonas nanhaiensis]UAW97421.1 pirin family protein [Halopseudomonas nanhaiensis]